MKQVCLLCDRHAADGNLFCQETACPAERSPFILEHGEWLGDIEIVKPIVILRTAVLYAARHQRRPVLLKVAHAGAAQTARLQREALVLRDLQQRRQSSPHLPTLLPPYTGTTLSQHAFGQAMLQHQLFVYILLADRPGEPLSDLLLRRPQPWIRHVGWIMLSLAATIALLQSRGLLHGALSPAAVLVHVEPRASIPQVVLVDLGLASTGQSLASDWYPTLTRPAATAPELLDRRLGPPGYSLDVYGLGLILFELLVGQPAFTARRLDDDEVRRAVLGGAHLAMTRVEDVGPIARLAEQAIQVSPAARQADAATLTRALQDHFGRVPTAPSGWWPPVERLLAVALGLLGLAFILALVVTAGSLAGLG